MQGQLKFDGAAYSPERDDARLSSQLDRVFAVMRDGEARTLEEISRLAKAPESSVSAQLRHLRKERFGSHTIERQHVEGGLYRYRLVVSMTPAPFNPANPTAAKALRAVK